VEHEQFLHRRLRPELERISFVEFLTLAALEPRLGSVEAAVIAAGVALQQRLGVEQLVAG